MIVGMRIGEFPVNAQMAVIIAIVGGFICIYFSLPFHSFL